MLFWSFWNAWAKSVIKYFCIILCVPKHQHPPPKAMTALLCFICSLWGAVFIIKGDLTHTVSPNLMLILSTYRVVLHPSYLQKVFSFIIFIKERYRFTIPLRKKPSSWRRVVWAELKSDEHLLRLPTKQSFDAVSLTICSSESWPGSFIAGTSSIFQY